MRTEIINTGAELLNGDTRNDNLVYLAGELLKKGLRVWRQTTVGDSPHDLKDAILRALKDSGLIFITGGLGPTMDDISKETVADVLGLDLELHEESLSRIAGFFEARGRKMPGTNLKQAMMPKDSLVLNNDVGTAPGLIIEKGEQILVILPGPPAEIGPMFKNQVIPYLEQKGIARDKPVARKIIKLWGVGESLVQETLLDLHEEAGSVEIAYQFRKGEVWVKLTDGDSPGDQVKVDRLANQITERLGKNVFGFDGDTMETVVARLLAQKGLTISLAESCTGGLIAKKLTDLPGSSAYLMYGVVSYSNDAKEKLLGVPGDILKNYGAVSKETALKMAEGVRKIGNTDLAISVTGIAGPGGGTKDKPVGLVYTGLAHPKGTDCNKHLFYGNRENIRELTARAALNMVRLYIIDTIP